VDDFVQPFPPSFSFYKERFKKKKKKLKEPRMKTKSVDGMLLLLLLPSG